MKLKINGGRLSLVALQALIACVLVFVGYRVGKPAYEDARYYETVEVTVLRREKAKLAQDIDPRYLFAKDHDLPDAFFVQTAERGWLSTDIDLFAHMGRGKMTLDITRRNGQPVIVGVWRNGALVETPARSR